MRRAVAVLALALFGGGLADAADARLDAKIKDRKPPRLMAATVNGRSITLTFNELLARRWTDPAIFDVTVAGEWVTDLRVRIRGRRVLLTMPVAHRSDDPVTLGFEPHRSGRAGRVADRAGNVARRIRQVALTVISPVGCSYRPDAPWNNETFLQQGRVRAVFLFVGYQGWPSGPEIGHLYWEAYRPGLTWFEEVSYGRLAIDATVIPKWFFLDRDPRSYRMNQRAFLTDVVALVDAEIDFSQYDLVLVAVPNEMIAGTGTTFRAQIGGGIPVDGSEVRFAVTFSSDLRLFGKYPGIVVARTSLLLGARYLHRWSDVRGDYWAQFSFVGGWDPMSFSFPRAGLLAWQRLRLGWLGSDQVRCLHGASGEFRITPLWSSGGVKALIVPTGPASAYFLEVRRRRGEDHRLCDEGVLVYSVNTTVGEGPARIEAPAGTSTAGNDACGPLAEAAFDAPSVFESAALRIEALEAEGDGSVRVRVTRR